MDTQSAMPLPPSERESFLAAQARCRAGARRWTAMMALAVLAITLVISLLLAPLAFALLGLLADVLNLLLPMPDLLGRLGRLIQTISDSRGPFPVGDILWLAFPAALPGFALLLLMWRRLYRIASERSVDSLGDALGVRAPRSGDFEEIQLGNLVEEMSLAAGRAPPRLRMIDSDACNLAIFGGGADEALIVTRGLLDRLNRAQTQALVGQAVAALGDGDGLLAERLTRLNMMIGLLSLLAQAPIDADARTALRPLLRLRRTDTADELASLRRVLGDSSAIAQARGVPREESSRQWREWAMLPLMGSLLIGILLVPICAMLFLAPLNSAIWRRRRLLADAMAVQFTRDPQALAEAYAELAQWSTGLGAGTAWLGDLFVLETKTASNFRVVSPYPALATRVRRLNAMGAAVVPPEQQRMPTWAWLIVVPLSAIVVGLLGILIGLGTWLSLAVNALFLALPTVVLHVALRAIGHA